MCDGVQSTETKLEGVSVSEFPFGNARTSCGLTEISQPKRTQNPRDVLEKKKRNYKNSHNHILSYYCYSNRDFTLILTRRARKKKES